MISHLFMEIPSFLCYFSLSYIGYHNSGCIAVYEYIMVVSRGGCAGNVEQVG